MLLFISCLHAYAAPNPIRDRTTTKTADIKHVLPAISKADLRSIRPVLIERIVVQGKMTNKTSLHDLLWPHRGKPSTVLEYARIESDISGYYASEGYLNTKVAVWIDPSRAQIVNVRIEESTLSKVEMSGNHRLDKAQIERMLGFESGDVLDTRYLERGLAALRQHPLIDDVDASLFTRGTENENVLSLTIKERKKLEGAVRIDNSRSMATGEINLNLLARYNDPLRRGDRLIFGADVSKGSRDWFVNYQIPVSRMFDAIETGYTWVRTEMITPELQQLEIENNLNSITVAGLNKYRMGDKLALWRVAITDSNTQLRIGAADLDLLKEHTRKIGVSAQLGLSRQINLNAALHSGYEQRALRQAYAYARFGGSLVVPTPWIRDGVLSSTLNSQFALSELPVSEKQATGGYHAVRVQEDSRYSYMSAVVVRTQQTIPLRGMPSRMSAWRVQGVAFFDIGKGWDYRAEGKTIGSLGGGFVANPVKDVSLELLTGLATEKDYSIESTRSAGVHIALEYALR